MYSSITVMLIELNLQSYYTIILCRSPIRLELFTCWHSTVRERGATWKPICSDWLSPPALLQAPLYLRTSRRYRNVLLLLFI